MENTLCRPKKAQRIALWAAGVAAVLFLAPMGAWAENRISKVEFGSDGKSLGYYEMIAPGQWVETDAKEQPQFQFSEVSRDEASIHLEDKSRGIALTLDIAKGAVTAGEIGAAEESVYQIMSSSDDASIAPPADADNQSDQAAEPAAASMPERITVGQGGEKVGEYVLVEPGKWAELNKAGETAFTFDEVKRTDTTILVEDSSRGLALTFDLAAKAVMFGPIGESQELLYDILDTKAADKSADPVADATAADDQQVDTATADAPVAMPKMVFPSQLKLKHDGWYVGRFSVTWNEPGDDGAELAKSWSSGEQAAPYFKALKLPETATDIKVLGEVNTGKEWIKALDRSVEHASNNCYVLSGTVGTYSGTVSDEPSESLDDDCS